MIEPPSIIKNPKTKDIFFKNLDITDKIKKKINLFVIANNYKGFLEYISKLIRESENISNMYVYLYGILATFKIDDEAIRHHICSRLSNFASVGWAKTYDPDIAKYINKNSLFESKLINKKYDDYVDALILEKNIKISCDDLDDKISYYYYFITDYIVKKYIDDEQYNNIKEEVKNNVLVYQKSENPIKITEGGNILDYTLVVGSLVSKEIQKFLEFEIIYPEMRIKNKFITNLSIIR